MRRKRALKVVLVVVGVIFCGLAESRKPPITRSLAFRFPERRGTATIRQGTPSAARRTNWWESREYEATYGHVRRPVRSRSRQGRFGMAAQR